jgi:hypothetical protein
MLHLIDHEFSKKNYNVIFAIPSSEVQKLLENIFTYKIKDSYKKDTIDDNSLYVTIGDDVSTQNVSEQNSLEEVKQIRVLLECNWTSSTDLCNTWTKMSKGNCRWENIELVDSEPADFYCVINSTRDLQDVKHPEKTIVFRMEPFMENHPEQWGIWSKPDASRFLFVGYHDVHYNNNEWHLSKTYNELMNCNIEKNSELDGILSTVLSDKYADEGHIKRIDFIKYVDSHETVPVHVYGGNKFNWSNYKGELPYHNKNDAMCPYKYVFNCENQFIKGYYTEKIIDAILSESLIFYHGCPDIRNYIDERAFVWLDLSNLESDTIKIKQAMQFNLWENRIQFIRAEKQRILNDKQFFPRLHRLINNNIKTTTSDTSV